MNQSNINPVKEQLRLLIEAYQRPLRGKLATLAPLRDEIFALHKKGASSAEIAALLAQCQVTISKDAVALWRSAKLSRVCSDKLSQRLEAEGAASSFQGVEFSE
jgi:hypothetical protein